MGASLEGTWKLVAWRRIAHDGTVTYPLGPDATGLLVYTPDGHMAVQITGAGRAALSTTDEFGGPAEQRADAYSTCLAYAGTYEVQGDNVVHRLDVSLFPNWAGTAQTRPFTCDDSTLVLLVPPADGPEGPIVNELSWARVTS